ncbi:MAG TPA: ABC transporter permease [Candidatus Limnocylindria bacterium]|nr:ABC transporter permease [Candidatus Limnocylindria bacterium]
MSAGAMARPGATSGGATSGGPPGAGRRIGRLLTERAVPAFTVVAILYLLLPIIVMIIFSFNDPPGRFNFVWGRFSLAAWENPFARLGLETALWTSIIVATISTIVATTLGTLIALALTRYSFRGRSAANLFIFIPMATPEIVLGASLLTLFVATAAEPWQSLTGGALFPLGLNTILVAHIMFNISYVVVTVRARMQGFPRHLEEAAMDLGANEWTTFWKVTFPLIFPGILAGALLAFSLSIDDFIITNFTSGTSNTFPIWVWASIRNNLPPQIHVIGTAVFVIAVGLVVFSTLIQGRSNRAPRRAP